MAGKEKVLTEDEKKNTVVVIGACMVVVGKVQYSPGDEFDLTDEEAESQGVGYLFNQKILEFKDDSKRTKELIENFTKKAKRQKEKTLEEREEAPTIK